MAGAGYNLFTTGSVLTAAQVNNYLQEQAVMRFASSAARTSALSAVLAEGMMSYLADTNSVEVYDGAAWVTVGNTGDITGVTAGTGISGGGTSGTVTVTNSMATTITTAGDLIKGTGSGTFDRLGIGSTGQVLTVASGAPSWATPASGGMTLLASGTLSGAAVTLSSISGSYIDLVLYMRGFYKTVGAGDVRFLISPTTTFAGTYQSSRYGTSLNTTITSGGGVLLGYNVGTTNTNNSAVLSFFDYASATSKKFTAQVYNYYNGTTDEAAFIQGINTNAAAMTSLTIEPTGNAWGGGTYALYGVK